MSRQVQAFFIFLIAITFVGIAKASKGQNSQADPENSTGTEEISSDRKDRREGESIDNTEESISKLKQAGLGVIQLESGGFVVTNEDRELTDHESEQVLRAQKWIEENPELIPTDGAVSVNLNMSLGNRDVI